MRIVKRILCLLLLICVLFTGCNSIIYSGNLHVKNYEPETFAGVTPEKVQEKVDEIHKEDEEKYNIKGEAAFYILPDHENKPDEIIDFKVLDYDAKYGLIYCYRTPYYGSENPGDPGIKSASGTAPKEWISTTTKSTALQVTVLMSYQPETRAYNVFFSTIGELDSPKTDSQESDSQSPADLTGKNLVMAHKMVAYHEYFLYVDNVAYLYNSEGTRLWSHDYGSVVSQEINHLKEKYLKPGDTFEATVTDVVMDDYRYVYIPITMQMSPKGMDESNLDNLDEKDSQLENSIKRVIFICCNLDIGTDLENPGHVLFESTNENWKAQIAMWKEQDGEVIGSKEDYEQYIGDCTMDRIKTGEYKGMDGKTDIRDSYPVFTTRPLSGNSLNMQMGYVKDLLQLGGGDMGGWIYSHRDALRTKVDVSLPLGWYWWSGTWLTGIFWQSPVEFRQQCVNLADAALVLQSVETPKEAAPPIRPLSPGRWEKGQNRSPFGKNSLEALFAYKTTVYGDGKQVSRYTDVRIPERLDQNWNRDNNNSIGKLPDIKPIAYTDPDKEEGSAKGAAVSRTLTYQEIVPSSDGTGENGEDSPDEEVRDVTVTETADPVPMTYALVLPKDTQVYWADSQETDDVIAPSGGFGVIHFKDISGANTSEQDTVSGIMYQDGLSDLFKDKAVPGRAVDAGAYHTGDRDTVVFVTSAGVKFYQRNGGGSFQTLAYIPLENLAQATGYSLSAMGIKTYTDQHSSDEAGAETKDTDDIMNKQMEGGRATEILSSSNFSILNQNEAVLSSLYSGLVLCNMKNGLTVTLEQGSYYASFPDGASGSGGKKSIVVGYQTNEYNYQPSDIVRAKFYKIDLGAESKNQRNQVVETYLDSLAQEYSSISHRIVVENGVLMPLKPEDDEKKELRKEEKLFGEDENTAHSQLATLMEGLGLGLPSEEINGHLDKIRQMFRTQRAALTVLYRLSGVGALSTLPTDGELLKLEGQLIQAGYPSAIESTLVELALTDRAVEAMPEEERKVYQEYQRQKKAMELSGQNMDTMDKINHHIDGSKPETEGKDDQTSINAMTEAGFYKDVLGDLEKRFETQGYAAVRGQSWQQFIEQKLKEVSPYRSIDPKEEGLKEFRQMSGITKEIYPDEEKLFSDLHSINSVWALEELIVEYKVEIIPVSDQSRNYRSEFEVYRENSFANKKDQREAFVKSKFYKLIEDCQSKNAAYLAAHNMMWESALKDIILICGSGVVISEP